MGVVYRAGSRQPARDVALKVLAPGCGGPKRARASRSRRGARPPAAPRHRADPRRRHLHSPHGEQPFLAMELVRGEPLHRWATKHTRRTAPAGVLLELCDAVHHAHQRGVIHRDLKPGNVIVDEQGRAKVLDFGIARSSTTTARRTLRTHTGQVLGTLAYMSPEQANGTDRVDVRTDVYALGVLGYELLTGSVADRRRRCRPLSAKACAPRRVEEAAAARRARDARLRGDLETIFGKALRKEPEQRYASAQAFADDLRRFLAHEPIARGRRRSATSRPLRAPPPRPRRRHRSPCWRCSAARRPRCCLGEGLRADAAESVTKFVEELFSQAAPEIAQGRTMTVVDLVRRGGTMVQEGLGDQPVRRARLARLLGTVLSEMGDHKAALPLAETAMTTLAAQLPADDPRLLEAMLTLAACRFTASDIAGAEPLFADVLARHERAGRGRDSGQFARAHEGLGACASLRRDLDKALTHYTTMQEARAADPSPDVRGLDLMRLGVVHTQRGDEAAADAALVAAYELLRTGKNQVAAAQLASNLGILRLRQGRPDDAEPLFAEALAIGDRTLGPEHPYQMRRLCNLAGLYSQRGRLDDAEPLLRRALAIAERAETGQGDVTANVLMNLGNVRSARGAHTEALDLYRRAAALYEAASGATQPRPRRGAREHGDRPRSARSGERSQGAAGPRREHPRSLTTAAARYAARALMSPPAEITMFLRRLRDGDGSAAAGMMPLVYDQLRDIAARVLRPGQAHTLQPTALVHEAWLKMQKAGRRRLVRRSACTSWPWRRRRCGRCWSTTRATAGAEARRRAPAAAARRVPGRRSNRPRPATSSRSATCSISSRATAPRAGQVVEMRVFGGMTVDEVAAALDDAGARQGRLALRARVAAAEAALGRGVVGLGHEPDRPAGRCARRAAPCLHSCCCSPAPPPLRRSGRSPCTTCAPPTATTRPVDDGMPDAADVRVNVWMLLQFLADGSTLRTGPHRTEVRQLVRWLDTRRDAEGRVGLRAEPDWLLEQAMATYAFWELLFDAPDAKTHERAIATLDALVRELERARPAPDLEVQLWCRFVQVAARALPEVRATPASRPVDRGRARPQCRARRIPRTTRCRDGQARRTEGADGRRPRAQAGGVRTVAGAGTGAEAAA
jgi:tetratricopeptide (TPR) repeat protein